MQQNVISVSEVNGYIKSLVDNDLFLSGLTVRGELSNYKIYPSGHHYFTLKDSDGALRCVMFKGSALRLRFRPENGMQVLASGRISVELTVQPRISTVSAGGQFIGSSLAVAILPEEKKV